MDAEAGNGEDEEDRQPPPLTNNFRGRDNMSKSSGSGSGSGSSDAPPLEELDEFTSLNAPVDDDLMDSDNPFKLSIEMPPPVVVAEVKRESRHLSKMLSENEYTMLNERINEWSAGELEDKGNDISLGETEVNNTKTTPKESGKLHTPMGRDQTRRMSTDLGTIEDSAQEYKGDGASRNETEVHNTTRNVGSGKVLSSVVFDQYGNPSNVSTDREIVKNSAREYSREDPSRSEMEVNNRIRKEDSGKEQDQYRQQSRISTDIGRVTNSNQKYNDDDNSRNEMRVNTTMRREDSGKVNSSKENDQYRHQSRISTDKGTDKNYTQEYNGDDTFRNEMEVNNTTRNVGSGKVLSSVVFDQYGNPSTVSTDKEIGKNSARDYNRDNPSRSEMEVNNTTRNVGSGKVLSSVVFDQYGNPSRASTDMGSVKNSTQQYNGDDIARSEMEVNNTTRNVGSGKVLSSVVFDQYGNPSRASTDMGSVKNSTQQYNGEYPSRSEMEVNNTTRNVGSGKVLSSVVFDQYGNPSKVSTDKEMAKNSARDYNGDDPSRSEMEANNTTRNVGSGKVLSSVVFDQYGNPSRASTDMGSVKNSTQQYNGGDTARSEMEVNNTTRNVGSGKVLSSVAFDQYGNPSRVSTDIGTDNRVQQYNVGDPSLREVEDHNRIRKEDSGKVNSAKAYDSYRYQSSRVSTDRGTVGENRAQQYDTSLGRAITGGAVIEDESRKDNRTTSNLEYRRESGTKYDTNTGVGTSKEPSSQAGQYDKRPPSDICENDCLPQKITLGETEKEQLKAAGLHILEIGQELLGEMNFIESVLNKFGAFVISEKDGKGANSDQSSKNGYEQERSCTAENSTKAQIIESIAAQAKQLCRLENMENQSAAEKDTNIAKAGPCSLLEPPLFSRTSACCKCAEALKMPCGPPPVSDAATMASQFNQNNNTEFRKRLAELEIKMDCMNSKLAFCENQVKEVYTSLCIALSKLSEETVCLRQQIGSEGRQGALLRSAIEDKIYGFEQQIIKLASVIWELKCETRVQMHFGKVDC